MTKRELIKAQIKELKEHLNDLSVDFVEQYAHEDIRDLERLFNEYAEWQVSDYLSDRCDYYLNNQETCDEAISSIYGDFAEFAKSYDDAYSCLCDAGAYGWRESNRNELESDKSSIIAILYLYNLLEFKEVEELNDDELNHLLLNIDDIKAYDFYDFEYCDDFEYLAEVLGLERC